MILKEQVEKYYNGNLIFTDGTNELLECSEEQLLKEKRLMESCEFGDEISNSNGENPFAVLDDVNTLKNLMAFAEITRYKETLLVDMTKEERDVVTKKIINNLDKFEVKPVGYEITQDSIVVAWYLNSVIDTFTFSCQVTGIAY